MTKNVLNFAEGCEYTGLKSPTMYKHLHARRIPHYKPQGKLVYFKKDELDAWLLRNRVSTKDEISQSADEYLMGKQLGV
jgi:excisionase family DNA binding protein